MQRTKVKEHVGGRSAKSKAAEPKELRTEGKLWFTLEACHFFFWGGGGEGAAAAQLVRSKFPDHGLKPRPYSEIAKP